MTIRVLARVLAFVATLFASHVAVAQDYWSSMGAGCVPAGKSVQDDQYLVAGGTVRHQVGKVGMITLFCSVHYNQGAPNPNRLRLLYRDSTGHDGIAFVRAQLIKMDSLTSVISVIAALHSDSFVDMVMTRKEFAFVHTLDFANSYYFVRVDLYRADTSQDVIFGGVSLATM